MRGRTAPGGVSATWRAPTGPGAKRVSGGWGAAPPHRVGGGPKPVERNVQVRARGVARPLRRPRARYGLVRALKTVESDQSMGAPVDRAAGVSSGLHFGGRDGLIAGRSKSRWRGGLGQSSSPWPADDWAMSTANEHVFSHGMRGHAGDVRALERATLAGPARLAGAQPRDRADPAGARPGSSPAC